MANPGSFLAFFRAVFGTPPSLIQVAARTWGLRAVMGWWFGCLGAKTGVVLGAFEGAALWLL